MTGSAHLSQEMTHVANYIPMMSHHDMSHLSVSCGISVQHNQRYNFL